MSAPGRPRRIDTDDIVRAGCEIGLQNLSLNAVAARLGVTAAALYRHIDGRWGLERLVGERILADLTITDDPTHDSAQHLLSFALQLRQFVLRHAGLGTYLQTLFPRGASGRQLLADEIAALQRRGYAADAAMVLSSTIANVVIGSAAAEQLQAERREGLDAARKDALAQLRSDATLAAAHSGLPNIDSDEYARLMLAAVVGGLVGIAPPERPIAEIMAQLHTAQKGL
ncbi:TetR/AcrR family transcriptional regulator C-terminal domain-containing protein [Pseudoclavibacter soli]|uniref:TetR/AcrR family transcriptional regulator C-terminal domain-containing protein n=1 Tax=Pseudoclavibacter soli TaxID=452623 RepID=UPI000420A860|nr:TetR/AcrR family transcriptional regulator C-terminal domain-containing protein [Pseudoclavibacter soli]